MRRFLATLLTFLILAGAMPAHALENWTIPMYSIDGKMYSILGSEAESYNKVGLYYTPVSKVYTRSGISYIVPLNEVNAYRAKGCLPLHAFLFEATFEEVAKVLGPFEYVDYYPGTPFSGDLPRYYYRTLKSNLLTIDSIGVYEGKCVDITMRLKDVFPYLGLFVDEYGKLTINQVMSVFNNNNLYGANYRVGVENGVFSALSQPVTDENESWYFFDYDQLQISIERGWDGNISFDTARCSFNVLV